MSSGPNIFEKVSDKELRPWTINPLTDTKLQEVAYQFEDCLVTASPQKWAGGVGVSVLDKVQSNEIVRNGFTTSRLEFETMLATILAKNDIVRDEVTEQEVEESDVCEGSLDVSEFDVDLNAESENAVEFIPARPASEIGKTREREALKSSVTTLFDKPTEKTLKSVKYVPRNGLHTILVSQKKNPKFKKALSLTVRFGHKPKQAKDRVHAFKSFEDDEDFPTLFSDLVGDEDLRHERLPLDFESDGTELECRRDIVGSNVGTNLARRDLSSTSPAAISRSSSRTALPAVTPPGSRSPAARSSSLIFSPVSTLENRFDAQRASTPALAKLSISSQSSAGHVLTKHKIKEMQTLKDQMKSTTGTSLAFFHPEFDGEGLPDIRTLHTNLRKQVQETKEFMAEDQMWPFFETAGFEEIVGCEEIYKSQALKSFNGQPGFVRAFSGVEIKRDSYTEWRESAGRLGYKV